MHGRSVKGRQTWCVRRRTRRSARTRHTRAVCGWRTHTRAQGPRCRVPRTPRTARLRARPSPAARGTSFVGVVAALVAVLCVARIAYTRYLLSRPPEPGMEPPGASSGQKRSLFSRLFAFGSSSRANADGYVPPAKNNTPPVDMNPVHVSITDDETHDGDGEGDGAPSSESAAVL